MPLFIRTRFNRSAIALSCLTVLTMSCTDQTSAQASGPIQIAATPSSTPQAVDVDTIFQDLQNLVKEYYPNSKVTFADRKLHFQFRVADLQSAHYKTIGLSPLPGGIIGDVSLEPGAYEGPDKELLPSDVVDGTQSVLLMAQFSRQRNSHLLAKLVYPPDVLTDFKDRFKFIVRSFNANEPNLVADPDKRVLPPKVVLKKQPPDVIYKNIMAIVKQYYPQATVTLKGNSLHFERKTRKIYEHYSRKLELAPDAGGILGDVELRPGEYNGFDKDRIPSEQFQGFRTTILLAPYSKELKTHMYVKMICPVDSPTEFKDKIKATVNSFNAGE
ncbi:hypothetical protein KBF38_05310 [bacterium]|nr:hypothetical protein [bacterium]